MLDMGDTDKKQRAMPSKLVPPRSGLAFVVGEVVLIAVLVTLGIALSLKIIINEDQSVTNTPHDVIVLASTVLVVFVASLLYWFYLVFFTVRYRLRLARCAPFGPGRGDPRLFARAGGGRRRPAPPRTAPAPRRRARR